jgi:hypothetical protein
MRTQFATASTFEVALKRGETVKLLAQIRHRIAAPRRA